MTTLLYSLSLLRSPIFQAEEIFPLTHTLPTEIIHPTDRRIYSPGVTKAILEEVADLVDRGTFQTVLREYIRVDEKVLPGRFVLSIKSSLDGASKFKSRFVAGAHINKIKNLMVHSSQTFQLISIRLLISLAAIHNFTVWIYDVKQAYLQSAHPLGGSTYIRGPLPESNISKDNLLKLLKPLYGISESGGLCHKNLKDLYRRDLSMNPLPSGSALFCYNTSTSLLKGLSGTYVDEMIRVGSPAFYEMAKTTHRLFKIGPDDHPPCTFTGFHLSRNPTDHLVFDQHAYLAKIRPISTDDTFSNFGSTRMQVACQFHYRPDLLFSVSTFAQEFESSYFAHRDAIFKKVNLLTYGPYHLPTSSNIYTPNHRLLRRIFREQSRHHFKARIYHLFA